MVQDDLEYTILLLWTPVTGWQDVPLKNNLSDQTQACFTYANINSPCDENVTFEFTSSAPISYRQGLSGSAKEKVILTINILA